MKTIAVTSKPLNERFYEKVIKVKADVAALLTFLVLCGFANFRRKFRR